MMKIEAMVFNNENLKFQLKKIHLRTGFEF